MKKFTFFIAVIGMIIAQSCSKDTTTPTDKDTISEVWEYNQNINFTANNNYSLILTYPHVIYTSDMVLVYRLSGVFQGEDVWKLQPETYFFDDGTLNFEYNFDFTRYDVNVYINGYNLASLSSSNKLNQVFRVVVVPGYFGKINKINFNDYNTVIKVFHINQSKIIKL